VKDVYIAGKAILRGPGRTVDAFAVGVIVDHRRVVKQVAEGRAENAGSAAERVAGLRQLILQRPEDGIEIVQERLLDFVAVEPREMLPVANLILRFRPFRLLRNEIVRRSQVVGLRGHDLPDFAVADSLDRLEAEKVVAVAEAGDVGESLLLGDLRRLDRDVNAIGVDAVRFLGEGVFPGLYRGEIVGRMKSGWKRDVHDIAFGDHSLVAVESGEDPIVGNVDPPLADVKTAAPVAVPSSRKPRREIP